MGLVGRHDRHLAGPQPQGLAGDDDFRLAFDKADQRIKGRGMLAQALPFGKGKQGHGPDLFADQGPAHHRPLLIVDQGRQVGNLGDQVLGNGFFAHGSTSPSGKESPTYRLC